jgi:hypothetical protein
MPTKLPKDPVPKFEIAIIRLVGLLSTLIILGNVIEAKIYTASLPVKLGVAGVLIALVVWLFLKRNDNDSDDSSS